MVHNDEIFRFYEVKIFAKIGIFAMIIPIFALKLISTI